MTVLDKVIAAVTPPESDAARQKARAEANAAATPGDWLSLVLEHHLQIESALAAIKTANDTNARRAAQRRFAAVLSGHSLAEEAVLYPALALHGEKAHATAGYTEQSATKIQLAALEELEPMSQDYLDKLEHIQGALQHHMYAEESNWFLDIKKELSAADQTRLTARYEEEFGRYMGADGNSAASSSTTSAGTARFA